MGEPTVLNNRLVSRCMDNSMYYLNWYRVTECLYLRLPWLFSRQLIARLKSKAKKNLFQDKTSLRKKYKESSRFERMIDTTDICDLCMVQNWSHKIIDRLIENNQIEVQ